MSSRMRRRPSGRAGARDPTKMTCVGRQGNGNEMPSLPQDDAIRVREAALLIYAESGYGEALDAPWLQPPFVGRGPA